MKEHPKKSAKEAPLTSTNRQQVGRSQPSRYLPGIAYVVPRCTQMRGET